MGCNTSKESVQPVGDEAKEDVKNGDIPKSSESSSAKVESQEGSQGKSGESKESSESKEEQKKEEKASDKDREEAATRIQAAFRGHHARKSMKETESSTKQTGTKSNSEPTKEQLQEEFRADDKELCEAATKIQASFRGHMSRKEQAASLAKSAENAVENVVSQAEEKAKKALNELGDIDLTDPDLHKAATKIQASFRGHKVRQEVSNPPHNEEPKK
ncbi:PREDICTED: HIRA-interacting protein 3 isoform X2 [Habropoda laboriosa]|uniref:HIRA-interacting protein 3 isoform X2 n=1 Tax=Habropoda laboriosa TaxID=597456 RepID=UPI00083DEAD7|nr:PREDICTED: HIRA-interacting protein 3 isoform X2 [Habropoda laboriosa]